MKRKFYSWEACLQLQEIQALKKLKHRNVIKLNEVIRESDELYFIFEYMEQNLYEKLKSRHSVLQESVVMDILKQILEGLSYIHSQGFFHRDIKPENILCRGDLVKIADLGLARESRSLPPYTEYVSTRWYRAPELLLHAKMYTSSVDLWAVGCILYELLTSQPLFPGKTEVDQLMKICSIIGSPSYDNPWPEAQQIARQVGFYWPVFSKIPLHDRIKVLNSGVSEVPVTIIESTLKFNPRKRATAAKLLGHIAFASIGKLEKSTRQSRMVTLCSTVSGCSQADLDTSNVHNLLGQLESQYYSANESPSSIDEIQTESSIKTISSDSNNLNENSVTDMLNSIEVDPLADLQTDRFPNFGKQPESTALLVSGQNFLKSDKSQKLPSVRIIERPINPRTCERKPAKFLFPRLKSPKRLFFQTIRGTQKQQQQRKRSKHGWPRFLSYRKHHT